MRPPHAVYEFVTTPDNWVGTHPVTAKVTGEGTDRSASQGDTWTELISHSDAAQNIEAQWTVVEAIPHQRWVITCASLGVPGGHCEIVYTFDEADGGTEFTRVMTVHNPPNDAHGTYLEKVKNALEG
jgi:hypothetical protein